VTGEQLHDRATRGQVLSAEERAQLQEWYARLDREEDANLDRVVRTASLAALHTQIDTALAQLATVTRRIQTLTVENAAIRQEIASLQAQLALKPTLQPA
jgi:predicted  nucleic acid-binding Zn-ribbon protein